MRVAHLRPFASHLRPVFMLLAALLSSPHLSAQEPIVGLPCEGCEAVFQGLPSALAATARIAPAGEPGTPMTITGRVLGPDSRPRSGVVVYAYQTNARGVYPPPSRAVGAAADRHGALRAWAVTGADGRYAFETIRPGSYPSRDTPEHVHMHVIERGCATYYIDDVMFTDDPLLTPAMRQQQQARAGTGVVTPSRVDGRWLVTRDIRLGLNIGGYPACRARPTGR